MSPKSAIPTQHIRSCRLIVCGAAHVDRTGLLDAPSALGCSNPGRFEETFGGTALNVASVAAGLGAEVELVSLVAQDPAGKQLKAELESRDITGHVDGTSQSNTGTYTSLIEPDGSLLVAIADMTIYEDFSADDHKQTVATATPSDWLCVDTNLPPDQVRALLDASPAKTVGLTVSKAKAPRMQGFADRLDLVFTNRIEVGSLCGLEEAAMRSIDDDTIASLLGQMGIDTAVISNGAKDVTVIEPGQISTIPVGSIQDVVDVTGAGDALVGASLVALMGNVSLAKAVELGIKAAQATIQSKSALRSDLANSIGLSDRAN